MKAGDIVEISNQTMGGKQILEGKAKLIKPRDFAPLDDGWEYWQVEFVDQKGEYFDRAVSPER